MAFRHWRRLFRFVGLLGLGPATLASVPVPAVGRCACEEPAQGTTTPVSAGARTHDPVIAVENGVYYVFSTGPGISVRASRDLVTWTPDRPALNPVPEWTAKTIPGSRNFYWAPDISRWDGKWHLYYAVSTFGSNRSAIGLATNVTLDPSRKEYKWVDEGVVWRSVRKDNYNAIDPNVAFDANGEPWLSFGSFWDGLVILPLDRATGRAKFPGRAPTFIARRSRENGAPGAIEAPFITRRGAYFYLFASFDFCCRGTNSTYNVRVGRSQSITGPYVDREGRSMMADGGTQILATSGRWVGPGHNGLLRDRKHDLMVWHAYDAEDRGTPKLRIGDLVWDRQGWPTVKPR